MVHQYTHLNTLTSPSAITSLATNNNVLAAGGGKEVRYLLLIDYLSTFKADGSIRLYTLPETKVHKAIRGLPDEVASLPFE